MIGAGIGQVNIVRLAKAMNIYVAVVSPKGNYPAIDYADELFECDIYNRDIIVEYAKQKGFTAVISDQNDLMMPTVAYVAEKCGFPGNTFDQVQSYCNKDRFRHICIEVGVPVPANITVTDSSVPIGFNISFPWIVKPIDSQSSMGISKINDINEYVSAVNNALSFSRERKVIVEQFFTGDEVVCEGFVYNGKYYNIFFGDRRYFSETLVPAQTLFPSKLDKKVQDKIVEYEKKITSHIDPSFGIIHSEYLVNKETGDICIVESAIRGGGVYISSHLIPLATGIDVNVLLIKCALGRSVDLESNFSNIKRFASGYVCFTLPEGVISEIKGIEKVLEIPGVKMCDIRDLEEGQKTHKMTAKGMRKGPIIIYGENRSDLEYSINKIISTINIKVKTKDGRIMNAIWS